MEKMFPEDVAYIEYLSFLDSVNSNGTDQNEAGTRLRIIDTILFDVLFWEKQNVDVEKRSGKST